MPGQAAEQFGIEVYIDPSRAAGGTKPVKTELDGLESAGKRTSDRIAADVARMNRALATLGQAVAGAGVAAGMNAASKAFSGLTAEFERQAKILERIRGPQRDYDATLRSLQQLFVTGKVSAEEYRKELGRLNDQARAAGVNIGSVVQAQTQKQGFLARGVGALGKLNPLSADTFGGTDALIKAAPVIAAAGAIAKLGDNYVQLQNKLRPLVSGQAELDSTMEALYEQSQRLRLEWEGSVAGYARIRMATKSLGLTQQQTLRFTEQLGLAIKVSGATGAEASAGIVQLGQAMASGRLQGDELRSILENLPVVAETIAKGMGVTIGQLRKLGSEGKISAQDIINAFEKADGSLRDRFGTTTATLGEQWARLKNAFTRAAGALVDFLDQIGVLRILGAAFDALLFVVDRVADGIRAIGGAISWVGERIGEFLGPINLMELALKETKTAGDATKKAVTDMGSASQTAALQIQQQASATVALILAVQKLKDIQKFTQASDVNAQVKAKVADALKEERDLETELTVLQKTRDKLRTDGHTKAALRIDAEIESLKKRADIYSHEYEDTQRTAAITQALTKAKKEQTAAQREAAAAARDEAKAQEELTKWFLAQVDTSKDVRDFERANRRAQLGAYGERTGFEDPNMRQYAAEKLFPDLDKPMGQMQLMEDKLSELRQIGIDAWTGIADAMTDFITKGELNFDRLIDNIIQQLIRLAITKALFGGGFDAQGNAMGGLAGLLGFAHGGQFLVGGGGGTDSQVVAFRATPGERVTVETKSQQSQGGMGGGGPVIVRNVNITDPAASLDVMRSGEGERTTLNHIRRNAGAIRRMLR